MVLFNQPRFRKPLFKLALVATALAVTEILLGTYVRLEGFDYGCFDWLSCSDEFSLLGSSDLPNDYAAELSLIESGLWAELAHWYLVGMLGLLVIGLAVGSWRRRDDEGYPFRLPTFILFFAVWQALFGMWAAKLTLWPQLAAVHIVMGMIICGLLWLLTLRLENKRWKVPPNIFDQFLGLRKWILTAIVLVIIQIIFGSWTSVNHAAAACTEFPMCKNEWWPVMDFASGFNLIESFGLKSLVESLDSEARVAIHMAHRLGAAIFILYFLVLIIVASAIKEPHFRRLIAIIVAVLVFQIYIAMEMTSTSSAAVILHDLGSLLLLLTLVTLATKVWTARRIYQRKAL